MSKKKTNSNAGRVIECGNPDFDWSPYDGGWNGKSLCRNKKVNAQNGDIVYSHESYAADAYKKLNGVHVESKELVGNSLVSITDINVVNENTLSLSINQGSNNVLVDMEKEGRFLNQFTINDGEHIDKDMFMKLMKTDFKQQVLGMNINAKLTAGDPNKASIWDGYVETLSREMKEQITKRSKAYIAKILGTNRGGFIVEIMDTVKAFMPGSMSSQNRITDFESMIGKSLEVMVESYNHMLGFIVSRKRFLQTMLPHEVAKLQDQFDENPELELKGIITGTTSFGIFVELNDYITGMVHKTLVGDELRQQMRDGTVEDGVEITTYLHKIDGNKVILSTVPLAERDAVIAKREAEEEEEDRMKAEAEAAELAAQQAAEANMSTDESSEDEDELIESEEVSD